MSEGSEAAPPAAVLFGCSGPTLEPEEYDFFQKINPWGFILFRRNCANRAQLAQLVKNLRQCVARPDAPVLIDQEGGAVARLRPPVWPAYPAPARFGQLYERNPAAARRAARLNARLIAHDLAEAGINVNCAPVLDLPVPGAHPVIGSRALARAPAAAAELGRAVCQGFADQGVIPVIKHIPGHGRARLDSHAQLPVVETEPQILAAHDFAPFHALRDQPLAMTAHIVYAAFDPRRPATQSADVIGDVVRGQIGFRGILLSDALEMNALQGPLSQRAAEALAAGCDAVLHCSGKLVEMREAAKGLRPLAPDLLHRLPAPRPADPQFDAAETRARLAELLGPPAAKDHAKDHTDG